MVIQHSAPFSFDEHALMLWLSGSSGFSSCHWFRCNEGIKPSLDWLQASLFIWVGVLCVREVDASSSLFLTWRSTYHLYPPCLVLLTVTQFCEWSHQSRDSLSAGIYGQWHHSLGQMHMFLLMSTATSHYLWSSPIFSGCSSRHPW